MIIGIHQPEHLPWNGFFDKVDQSDIFVLLDNVPFEKNYFQNRNRIRTRDGWAWLTVPVYTSGRFSQLINEVEIIKNSNWRKKHWKTLFYSYKNAPYWERCAEFFKSLYQKEWHYLVDLNETIIRFIIGELGIKVKLVKASELNVSGRSTELLLNICKELGADVYLSGKSGREYLDEHRFKDEKIEVMYQDFKHPIYPQQFEPFIPQMSTIDLMFNCGDSSLNILRHTRAGK